MTFKRRIIGLSTASTWMLLAGCGLSSPAPGAPADASAVRADESTRSAATAGKCLTPEDAEQMCDEVLQLVNLQRTKEGLAPVVSDTKLAGIASKYACSMAAKGFFGHRDPESNHGPGERALSGRYSFFAIGENLAAGQETPQEVMRAWMESEAHRAIILDPSWKEVGIGVRIGGEYDIYWVQEFGDPTGS